MSVLQAYPAAVPLLDRLCTKENSRMEEYGSGQLNKHRLITSSNPREPFDSSRWQNPHTHITMSDYKRRVAYDVSPSQTAEVYPTRAEINVSLPREQLPPLSSILGTSRPGIHSLSPYSDQSPTFPPTSPLESRHTPGSTRHEQPAWDAYSQLAPPHTATSKYPHNARQASSSVSELPQPSLRTIQVNQSSNSSQFYDSRYSPKDSPRLQLPPSRTEWLKQSDSSYREYFPATSRDTSSSFRPQPDQHHTMPPPPQRKEFENGLVYKDSPGSVQSMQHYTTVSPNSVISESLTSKDGLGPKIWTGTQFLPRFVRQAEVPGEGLCYFYDDGTHCKTHIDGEAVNAHWGVTKAGKPRKRLAIACITCREKKIKCDPDYPRCTQCEKFGRICKFKNAPRGGHGSPDMSSDAEEPSIHPAPELSNCEIVRPEKAEISHGTYFQQSHRPSSRQSDDNPTKRIKYGHPSPTQAENYCESQMTDSSLKQLGTSTIRTLSDDLATRWTTNPFDMEEKLVMDLMRIYFIHKDISGAHGILPEKPFMLWLTNRCFPKSPDDLMLIYTMLALATVFSTDLEHKVRGQEFLAISRYACDQRHYSLQLVQSRLLLALYYYANSNVTDSWDFFGAAMRTATGMKLNLEIGETGVKQPNDFPYNLSLQGYAECRRRTFWTCFILDRFNGYCSGQLSIINPEDIFLRLPCDDVSFEGQVDVQNPYFDHKSQMEAKPEGVGEMAYLIMITFIWGDIMANIYRTSHRLHHAEDKTMFRSFYLHASARLESWHGSLPEFLSYSLENLNKAAKSGTLNIFITLHTIYHSAQMRLNRNVNPDAVPPEQLEHHIRIAYSNAEAVLHMADKLAAFLPRSNNNSSLEEIDNAFSAPFVGYAVVHAVDIVTAKGYISDLPLLYTSLRGATTVVTHLAKYWQSAKNQKELLVTRNADLIAGPAGWKGSFGERNFVVVKRGEEYEDRGKERDGPHVEGRNQKLAKGTYEMKAAIDQTLVRDHDSIYAVEWEIWDRALTKFHP